MPFSLLRLLREGGLGAACPVMSFDVAPFEAVGVRVLNSWENV